MSKRSPRNSANIGFAVIAIIVASAIVLGIVSYSYAATAAQLASKDAIDTVHSNAQVSAHDIAEMLKNRITDVQNNIKIISRAPLVQSEQVSLVHILFSTAKEATSDVTDSYYWVDKDGKLLWANAFDSNATLYAQYAGADTSFREYYSVPKETLQPYITKVTRSLDGVPRIFVAQPIISNDNQKPVFRGVVAASISVPTLGKFLESQLAPQFNGTIGMLDKEGQIIYSTDTSTIGQDVFGQEFQSKLPDDLKQTFNDFLRTSLKGNAGFQDFSYQGVSATLAYQPVILDADTWAVMYVVVPHSFAETVQATIDNQRNLSILTTISITGVALGLAVLAVRWNKDLSKMVKTRTKELEIRTEELNQSNESLLVSNKKLEQAYDDLLIHDKMQKEFVNIAAHELRTPVQPLLAAAELMGEQLNSEGVLEVSKAEVDLIIRNASRLERLSNDILEISRIESGGLKLRMESFSMSYIISDAIKDAKTRSPFDEGRLKFSFTPDDLFVYADKEKIMQVVSNLLSNSIKFTDSGTISINSKADAAGKSALISIRDTGNGIDPEIIPRLFEKFATKSEKGTGIGLYISKKIIEAHGGQIWGENNPEGKGATFAFTLPLATKEQLERI